VILGVDGTPLQGVRSGSGWYLTHLLESLSGILEEDKILVWMNNASGVEQMRVPQNRLLALAATHFPGTALKLSWGTLGSPTLEGLVGRSLDVCLYACPPLPPQKKGVKAIYLHDLAEWVATESQPNAPSRLAAKEFERVLSEVDLILTGSDYNRQAIKKRYPTFPDEKFRTIPPVVAPMFQRPALADQVEAVRKDYGLHRPYFLYAGTLETRKNLLRMVHAFLLYQQQSKIETDLVLAGPKGWIGEDFMQFILSPALKGKVRWIDLVPPESLAALYSGATLFAYPSHQEGSGAPILEAMGCGAPVICSDTGALPEWAGSAALLVPPNHIERWVGAFQRVAGDLEVREEMRRRGFERATNCRWETAAQSFLTTLRSAVGRRG